MSYKPDDSDTEFDESRIDALIEKAWNLRAADPVQGLELAQRALAAARARNYQAGLAKSLSILAACNYRLANYEIARTQSMEALENFNALSDKEGQADILNTIGNIHSELGDLSTALSFYIQGLTLRQELSNKQGEAASLNNIGNVQYSLGDYANAMDSYLKSLHIKESIGDEAGIANSLNNIGNVHKKRGDAQSALTKYEQSLLIFQKLNNRYGEAVALGSIGEIHIELGDPLAAIEYQRRSLEIEQALGNRYGEAESLLHLGEVYLKNPDVQVLPDGAANGREAALVYFQGAINIANHLNATELIYKIHLGLSKYYQETGDFSRALEHYQAFHATQQKIFDDDLTDKTTKLQIIHQVEASKREADLRLAETEVLRLKNIELNAQSQELTIEVGEGKQMQRELLRRNQQLAAAAEVARITTSTLDLVTLLTTSVEVIREKFNFYHASVFLVDHSTNMVILEGSTGEAGRQLKASHHQLAIGSNSLVGLATATHQPVVVQDVTNDPTHFKNPLLPDTQAEAVIPLLSNDVVVGALDVQSTFADAFSDSDVTLLITIADQLTVAIENARLYASAQKELAERKRAEQALQEIRDALEIRVQERTAELKHANEQLQVELAERKRIEKQLEQSLSTLQATIESTTDGILVVDRDGRIESFNQRFVEMWHIPDTIIESRIDDQVLASVLDQLVDPDAFKAKVQELYRHSELESFDVLLFKDGRVFERYSRPQQISSQSVGRVWSFRDVTERKQAERRNIVFSQLGQRLSLVTKPRDAARVIVEAADELLGWDCCIAILFSPIRKTLNVALSMDLIEGERVEVPPAGDVAELSPMQRLVIQEGPQLILNQAEDLKAELISFGDKNRPSASILYVPIRHGNNTTSFLTIQSYTPNAYDRTDLDTLQLLADYCAGALDRIWAEEAQREIESKYRGIFENSVVGIYQTSPEGQYLSANAALARILGYDSPAALMDGTNDLGIQFYVDPGRREEFKRIIDEYNVVNGFESEVYRKDGSTLWVSEYGHGVRDQDGTLLYFEGVTEDITARKQAEAALHESEERYAVAMRGANDGLWDWNLKTDEIYYSPRWKSMFGCEEEDVNSSPDEWFNRIHPDDISAVRTELDSHLKGKTAYFESEHRMRHADGHYLWVLSRGLALRNAKNEAFRIAGSQTDITIRKKIEERLEHDALHDGLTGLPNRTLFLDRLEHAIKRIKRSKAAAFAVLFVDIDRFKLVNDSLGHESGDQLLMEIGERLKICLRPGDTVARLGGDEFAIILDAMKSATDAMHIAGRIQQELSKPFNLNGHYFSTSASIGISLSKPSYNNAEDLLRDADTAMYRAKTTGKARHEIFDKDMNATVTSLLQLETDLRNAIQNDEFQVYYQPLISLATRKVVGTEALLRWQHPERGLLPPSAFITVLEETGMILQVGERVLKTACEQNKIWQDSGNSRLRVAVNFSARQFQLENLTEMVRGVLQQTGMDPQTLELEITESTAIQNTELTLKTLEQLHELGVGISLDDFGSGYSALGYLGKYPFHSLKADRSFISDIPNDSNDMAITSAIIAMAHSLKLKVVAEGVETTKQLEFLLSNNCDEVQGFLFSRPVPAQEMTKLLLKKDLLPAQRSKSKKQAKPTSRSKPISKKAKK